MKDRVSTEVLENGAIRYAEYDSSGAFVAYHYFKPADEPIQDGTPINKATLLKDATASLFSLGVFAVPDDVLAILGRYLRDDAVHLEVVSYVGTGTYGQSNACSVTFSFAPKLALMLCQKSNGQGTMIFGVHRTTVSNSDVTAMSSDALGTSYPSTSGGMLGFTNRIASNSGYSYGKKSSDGKTFSWYYEDSASVMFNNSGTTYYVLGIG